ncbi:MAG: AlpA family transcriptional regulator [bacterium]|nr:AlpA family transcriptional regulator [bacterium]
MSLVNAAAVHHPTPPTRLLRRPEVLSRTGMANSTLYAAMAQGRFPKPVKIGARSVAWPEEAVVDWIANRPIAELRTEEAAG